MIFSGNFMIFNKVGKENFGDDQIWYFGQFPATSMTRGLGFGGGAASCDGEGRKNTRSFYNGSWWRVRRDLGFQGLF